METEFIYWRRETPVGIVVEEISGGEDKSPAIWFQMARQIFCENGPDGFREVGHFENGAPFLYNSDSRLSISHTYGLFVAAYLPKTPEAELKTFSLRTAMGVDTERKDREQVLRLRERFLNERELAMIPADNLIGNIVAWTAKEALYKSAFNNSADWRKDIEILDMPDVETGALGKASITLASGETTEMNLYSYLSDDFIVTIAYSPRCAKFKSKRPNRK